MKRITGIKILIGFIIVLISTSVVLLIKNDPPEISDLELSPSYRQTGNKNAKIIIIEYSDFSCPACEGAHQYIKNLIKYFGNDFLINFKHFPLTEIHPYSFQAAVWSECAGIKYNKFWEFGNILFENRKQWMNNKEYKKLFYDYSKKINLNPVELEKCVNGENAIDIVKSDMKRADLLKLNSTPTFFVNGKIAVGVMELIQRIKEVKNGF